MRGHWWQHFQWAAASAWYNLPPGTQQKLSSLEAHWRFLKMIVEQHHHVSVVLVGNLVGYLGFQIHGRNSQIVFPLTISHQPHVDGTCFWKCYRLPLCCRNGLFGHEPMTAFLYQSKPGSSRQPLNFKHWFPHTQCAHWWSTIVLMKFPKHTAGLIVFSVLFCDLCLWTLHSRMEPRVTQLLGTLVYCEASGVRGTTFQKYTFGRNRTPQKRQLMYMMYVYWAVRIWT